MSIAPTYTDESSSNTDADYGIVLNDTETSRQIDWVGEAVARKCRRLGKSRRELPIWLPGDEPEVEVPHHAHPAVAEAQRWDHWHRCHWEELAEFIDPQAVYEDDTNPIFRLGNPHD